MERYLLEELGNSLKDVEDLRLRYLEGQEVQDEYTIEVLGNTIAAIKSILDEEGQVEVNLELLGRTHLEKEVSGVGEMEEEYFSEPVESDSEYEFTNKDEEIVELTREIESDKFNSYEKSDIKMTEETTVEVNAYGETVEEKKKEKDFKSGENVDRDSNESYGILEKIKNFFVR